MEKRTLLAFILMAVVLAISQYLFTPSAPPPEGDQGTPPPADTSTLGAPTSQRNARTPSRPARTREGGPKLEGAAIPPAAGVPADPVRVETPLYALVVDRRGGVVTQVSLKRYPSYVDSLPVQLVPSGEAYLQRTIRAGDRELDLTGLLFDSDRETLRVGERSDSLVLTARTAGGVDVRQVFRFSAETYEVDYRVDVEGLAGSGGVLETRLGPRLRSTEKSLDEDLGSFAAVARVGREVHSFQPKHVAKGPQLFRGSVTWAGIKSKYFLCALVSTEKPFERVTISAVPDDSLPGLEVVAGIPLEGGAAAYAFYLGPQEYRSLAAAGGSLQDVNQYGWSWIRWAIQPFAHLIVRILLWMHQLIPNYGVVLIIFGILVRLVMWPLTHKSFVSMQKMQVIQPEMQRLRERFKNDPQRMQQEMMKLYKERGVNPLGGCLPNLLPLPILFALFFVFQNTIEFRGAPFVGWIQDLSRPDPYYVLPILMGVTMFIQQKLTPVGDNPQMKVMLYFMPPFLTFIFLNLAAGLVLYYTVSNVLTFAQQLLLKRRSSPAAEAPVPAPR